MKEAACLMDVQTSQLGMETLLSRTVHQTSLNSRIPLPDNTTLKSVLSAQAQLSVTGAVCGSGQVQVSGGLTVTFVCASAADEPFGFTASSTFTHEVAVEGVTPDMRAEATAQVLESEYDPGSGAIEFSLQIELSVTVQTVVAQPFVTGITGTSCEAKYGPLSCSKKAMLGESNLRLREELSARDARRVLSSTGSARIDAIAFSGGAANVDGTLYVTVLYDTENGQLHAFTSAIPFRDSFAASMGEDCFAEATVPSLSVVAADADFGVCDAEAVVNIRLFGAQRTEQRVLFDAYDTGSTFTCRQENVDRLAYLGCTRQVMQTTENLSVPKHLPEVYRPIYVSIMPAITGTDGMNDRANVDAMLLVTAVYQCDGGFLHSFSEDVPVRFTLNAEPAPIMAANITVLSAQPVGSGRLLEVGITCDVFVAKYACERATLVSEITAGGTKPTARGIIVYCADAGDTLWDVGKRFAVPVPELLQWNQALAEPLAEGTQIVLMK